MRVCVVVGEAVSLLELAMSLSARPELTSGSWCGRTFKVPEVIVGRVLRSVAEKSFSQQSVNKTLRQDALRSTKYGFRSK